MKFSAAKWILFACGMIGCLALTAALFLGPMVVVKTAGYTQKARQVKIHTDLKSIIRAAELYRAVEGRFPRTVKDPLSAKDPWGNRYTYRVLGDRVRVSCLGPDGREGGNDDTVMEGPEETG